MANTSYDKRKEESDKKIQAALEARRKRNEKNSASEKSKAYDSKIQAALDARSKRVQSSMPDILSDIQDRFNTELDAYNNAKPSYGMYDEIYNSQRERRLGIAELRSKVNAYRKYLGSSSANDILSAIEKMEKGYDAYLGLSKYESEDAYNKAVEQAEEYYANWGHYADAEDFNQYSSAGNELSYTDFGSTKQHGSGGARKRRYTTIDNYRAAAIALYEHNGGEVDSNDTEKYSDQINIYRNMKDDEFRLLSYFIAKDKAEGTNLAEQYVDAMGDTLRNRRGYEIASDLDDINIPVIEDIAKLATGFAGGYINAYAGISQYVTGENLPTDASQYANQYISESLDGFAGYAHQAATTIGNMMPSILVGAALGPAAGAATMGVSVAGNAYAQALDWGYDKTQARVYGTIIGALEGGLQYAIGGISKLSGLKMDGKILSKIAAIDKTALRIAAKLGWENLKEIGEEELQNYLEPLVRTIVLGEEYDAPTAAELFETAIVTLLSTSALEGSGVIINDVHETRRYTNTGKSIMGTEGGFDALQVLADEVAGVSDAKMQAELKKQAGNVTGEIATGKNIVGKAVAAVKNNSNATKLGRLYNTIQTANNLNNASANQADIAKSLQRKGFNAETANDIAEALVASYNGQELTKAQEKLLKSAKDSKVVQDAISNIMVNEQSTMGQRSQNIRDFQGDVKAGAIARAYGVSVDTAKEMLEGKHTTEEKNLPESQYEVSVDGKTIDSKGNVINIVGVETIEDGKMILKTEDGTIDSSEVQYASEAEALVYEAVARMGASPASAWTMIKAFNEADGVTAKEYATAAPLAYLYGKLGYEKGVFVDGKPRLSLTDTQSATAYQMGRSDAEASVKTGTQASTESTITEKNADKEIIFEGFTYSKRKANKVQKASMEAIEMINKMSSLEIHVYQSYKKDGKLYAVVNGKERLAPNGYYTDGGKVYVDINAGNMGEGLMLYTLSHEIGHHIARYNAQDFKAISDFLFEHYGENVPIYELLEAQKNKLKKSYKEDGKPIPGEAQLEKEAHEELVCDMLSRMLADKYAYDKLMEFKQKDLNSFQKLGQAIKKALDKLAKALGIYDTLNPDFLYAASKENIGEEAFRQLQDMYIKAFVQADANFQGAEKNTIEDDGEKFSFRDSETGMANDLLLPYGEELSSLIENSGGIIVDSFEKLQEVVNTAFDEPTKKATAYFGILDSALLEQIEKKVPNIPKALNGKVFKVGRTYSIAASLDSIRHLADEKGLTREDVLDYLDRMADTIIENDTVSFDYYTDSRGNKLKGLLFKKTYDDGTMVSFEIVSSKKMSMNMQTMYMDSASYQKKKSAKTPLVQNTPAHTPKARVSQTSDINVAQISNEVKNESVEAMDVEVDTKTESVAPAVLKSERTWTESDYVQEREQAAKEIAKAIGVSVKKAKAYIDSVNSIAKMIAEDRVRLDYFSSPGRSSFVGNVEYGGSFDFSTLCKKRRLLTGTFTAIQKALPNTALTADEILKIRNRMKEAGLEVSCGLCYVEGSRANMGQFAKEFLKLYKQYYPDAWQPNMADVNTPDGIEWVRINHPECYKQYEYFWNHYGTLKPGDKNLFASQQKPKLYQLHTEYKGEVLEKFNDDDNVEAKNLNGGIRLQSFSDFEIVHLIDTMQIIMDMSRVGLAGQAYTKVPDFAWALGDTGLKINLSLIAKGVDENGKLIFDDVEGMPIDEAMKLRDRYSKNVGTILVAFNDEQLLAAMADDRVDFIIPFHRSQWKKSQYGAMGLPAKTKDYTYMQNEKFIKPQYHEYRGRMVQDKATNYMPNEYWDFSKSGKENAEAYLEMCARNNKRPKFYKLLQNNGDGSYSLKADGSTDGYWKLLIDFKMYDNDGNGSPQMPVKPDFNMDEAQRMLNDYQGGHSNFPVAQGVVDSFVEEYKENHKGVQYSDRDSLTPEQQKNFDYNQKQKTVGSALKTLKGSSIKRSTKYGVGKEIGGEIYFHKDYAEDILPDEVLSQALQLLEEEHPGFEYNCLKYNPKTGVVAFQEAPDFDSAREPVVGDYVSVNTDTGVVKTGHSNYIWHHKWNWVKNDYSSFDVAESWNWSKQWLSTLTEVSDGNGIERWNTQLDKFGLPRESALFSEREQEYDSKDTSVKILPATFTKFGLKATDRVLDWGGGQYDIAKKAVELGYPGIKFEVVDAFNRTKTHNDRILKEYADNPATVLTINNVLNVIKETDIIEDVIRESKEYLSKDGVCYIKIYEGNDVDGKTGNGKVTSSGWQNNQPAEWYRQFAEKYYQYVERSGDILIASDKPIDRKSLPKASKEATEAMRGKVKEIAKSEPSMRASLYSDRDNAPTFYSQMAKVVDSVKQEKLGASSVVSMLRGKGVKAEEIKWSGIEEWLEGKKSVTKAELQEFIAGSMLQIEEEVLDNKDRPYTEEQKKRLDEYETKRDEVAKRLADEWKKITGEDFPIRNAGAGLESAVVNKIIDANKEHKDASFEGRLLAKLRKDVQKVIDNNDDFGFDSWKDALRSIHRHRRDFITHYEMSSSDKAVIVKYCNALNAYNELPNMISDDDAHRLLKTARETDPWNRKIMEVKNEYNEESAKHMTNWGQYRLKGGENYREMLFRIPGSNYTNEAMMTHWKDRKGVLAHARVQDLNTFLGKMLFIDEIQSDWHNEGHKSGYREPGVEDKQALARKMEDYTEEFFSSHIADVVREKITAVGYEGAGVSMILNFLLESQDSMRSTLDRLSSSFRGDKAVSFTDSEVNEIAEYARRYEELYQQWQNAPGELTAPDAPFSDTYHEYVLKRLLREAAEQDYDSIGWTPADTQMERWNPRRKTNEQMGIKAKNPNAVAFEDGYRIEYDQDIPKFLNKYGKKWGTKVGKTVLDNGTEVWSMAITDSMKESVMTEGQPLYSERVLMGSLFSGGGTLEAGLAYQMLDKQFGVEYDGKIASVYADNHGDHIQVGRVEDFDISKYDYIFYLHASPVCHNFSAAKHGAKELAMDIASARATAKHLETAMPQVFTVENAPGYRKSQSLKIITDKLTELGYKWDVDVYNSADYGSATSRNRVILRAVKDGELPAKPTKQDRTNSWDKVTRDLWDNLPKAELRPSFISAIENTRNLPILDANGKVNVNKPLLILTTTSGHTVTYCWEGDICPTLTTKCGEARLVMPDGNIYAVTPEFMGRIQGLPNDYKYPKEKTRAFTIIGNGIPTHLTKAVVGGVLDSAYEQTHDGHMLYQDRAEESVSNRSLLANAFEGLAQNDIERNKIQEYRSKVDLINEEERKLNELNAQIKELSFSRGPRDTKKIRSLQFEANQAANRINTYDKQLLRLEASKPLQDVLAREKKKAYQKAEKRGKDALAAYKEKTAKTQRALLEKWQESRKKGIESREKTAMRHKIQSVVGELNQLLLSNDKKRHVPDSLKKAVADALALVNMDTVGAEERAAKYAALIAKETDPDKIDAYTVTMENILRQGDKMGQRLKELRDAYEEIQNSDDPDIANAYDPVIAGALKELAGSIGDTSLRDMSIEQLQDVYSMYKMVLTRVRDANKSFIKGRAETISNLASRVVGEVKRVGGEHKYRAAILDFVKKFGWDNMKPVYAFEHIGSSTLTDVFNSVRTGEDVWAVDVTEARKYYLDKSKKYSYDSWDFKKKYSFKSASEIGFDLTLEQILSLYAYSKREQAHDHLRLGGFVFDSNIETYKENGNKLIKYKVNTADAHQITPEILANIISNLTEEQKSFADEMQEYLSAVMGAKGNEVTMAMYGVKLFKEKFYFPLKSAKQFMFEQNEVSGEVRIKNSGFTNKVVAKANNPVILSNFMDVWANHVNDMSMYHAFVLPLEDFNRVFNYNSPKQEGQPPVSVKGTIQNAYGPSAVGYVRQLITDLNGGARSDSTTGIINKMIGLFKKGSVFASLSVVVQQPSAIARAAALVDTKYFIGPKVDHKRHKALWDEVKQYAPVAIIKEMGYFDTNMGKSTQDFIQGKEYNGFKDKMKALVTDSNYRDEILSKAPALADEIAWCGIWEAVKRETQAKNPGMDVKSEAFLKKAGERFTEVVTKTQVYDSVLSRSGMMRSKDTGMKMATAFMAEPTTSINMIADALLQGKRGNRKYARTAIGAVIASQIINSILVSFVYAGRDDDEDETYWEKYIGTLSGEILDSLNPAGYIPFIKDIVSIVQGYDVERSDMAVVSDLWKAWENLSKDNMSVYRKVEGFAGSIAQIFGLPVKNIMRDVRGIYQTIMSFVNGQQTTAAGIGYAVKGAITGEDVSNQQQLYEAYLSGDTAHIARVESRFEDQKAIYTAMRTAIKDHYEAGEIDYDTAKQYLVEFGGLEEDDAYWKVQEWEYETENGDNFQKYNNFYTAVQTGKNLKAVIKEYTDNGVESKTLASQITSYFKPLYKEMSNVERAAIKGYLLNAYELLGYERSKKSKDIDKWVED